MTIEQLMKINLISNLYKDDNSKYVKELIKTLYGDLEVEASKINEILDELNNFMSKQYDLVHRFEYNGKEWGFIPNLSKMTTGEFIDLDNYLNENDKQLHKICAILYRPITKSFDKYYLIEKYEGTDKYCEELKGVDATIILGAMVFFYNLSKSLLNLSNTYIQNHLKKVKKT